MTAVVALLRGMNIGGKRLPVAALREAAGALGWEDPRTYLASGNLVARAAGPEEALARAYREALKGQGLDVPVLVLSAAHLRRLAATCPFAPAEGKHVHAFFLWGPARLDRDRLEALRAGDEALELHGRVAWLHAPSGVAQSRLALKIDKVLTGTEATARNLNTVQALVRMVDEAEAA